MSSSRELDKALDVLRKAGHQIGPAHLRDSRSAGGLRVPIDGVPKSFEEIYELAAKENRKPRKAERTGEYVTLKVESKRRRGTLGDAIIENDHLEYLFKLDARFDVQGAPPQPFYVPESDVETHKRPTDEEVRVILALENPKYDWRTIGGISEETGIDPVQVSLILNSNSDVVQSSVPDKSHRLLFTTRNHYNERQNIANRILSAVSDRIK